MNILSKVALLSLLVATNNAEVLRPKKLASKQGTTTPAPPTIAGSEDIPPPCITPSSNGDDQRACGPGAVCIGTSSFGVSCDQRGLESPSCVTDGCNQDGSNSPSCLGKSISRDQYRKEYDSYLLWEVRLTSDLFPLISFYWFFRRWLLPSGCHW